MLISRWERLAPRSNPIYWPFALANPVRLVSRRRPRFFSNQYVKIRHCCEFTNPLGPCSAGRGAGGDGCLRHRVSGAALLRAARVFRFDSDCFGRDAVRLCSSRTTTRCGFAGAWRRASWCMARLWELLRRSFIWRLPGDGKTHPSRCEGWGTRPLLYKIAHGLKVVGGVAGGAVAARRKPAG